MLKIVIIEKNCMNTCVIDSYYQISFHDFIFSVYPYTNWSVYKLEINFGLYNLIFKNAHILDN